MGIRAPHGGSEGHGEGRWLLRPKFGPGIARKLTTMNHIRFLAGKGAVEVEIRFWAPRHTGTVRRGPGGLVRPEIRKVRAEHGRRRREMGKVRRSSQKRAHLVDGHGRAEWDIRAGMEADVRVVVVAEGPNFGHRGRAGHCSWEECHYHGQDA